MTREEYARNYSATSRGFNLSSVVVIPDDVQRVSESEPCFMCGKARGVCRHRPWSEAA